MKRSWAFGRETCFTGRDAQVSRAGDVFGLDGDEQAAQVAPLALARWDMVADR